MFSPLELETKTFFYLRCRPSRPVQRAGGAAASFQVPARHRKRGHGPKHQLYIDDYSRSIVKRFIPCLASSPSPPSQLDAREHARGENGFGFTTCLLFVEPQPNWNFCRGPSGHQSQSAGSQRHTQTRSRRHLTPGTDISSHQCSPSSRQLGALQPSNHQIRDHNPPSTAIRKSPQASAAPSARRDGANWGVGVIFPW